jgi:hypothetical protein
MITDIHENISSRNRGSEIVFESHIFSEKANKRWDIDRAIDERVYDSGALEVYNLNEVGVTYVVKNSLFDSFVLQDETELKIKIEGYEIDRSTRYNISETNRVSKKESLGEATEIVPLKNGDYNISAKDWSGKIKVEVLEIK